MTSLVDGSGILRRTYRGAGGDALHYRVVRAPHERRRLVYLHGIESHGDWFLPAAEHLAVRGTSSVLLDRRGSGINRHLPEGHAESAEVLLEDVRALRDGLGEAPVALVGLSWGGKLALACALDRPAAWSRLVLITPGLVPRVDLPLRAKLRLLWCFLARPRATFSIPIEPEMFTVTPHWLDYIRADPLRLHRVTASFLRAGLVLDRRIRAGIAELQVPTLLLLAARDRIVDNARTAELLGRAPAACATIETFEAATHSIQFDRTEQLVARLQTFLAETRT